MQSSSHLGSRSQRGSKMDEIGLMVIVAVTIAVLTAALTFTINTEGIAKACDQVGAFTYRDQVYECKRKNP